jgi:hypothetical protein
MRGGVLSGALFVRLVGRTRRLLDRRFLGRGILAPGLAG